MKLEKVKLTKESVKFLMVEGDESKVLILPREEGKFLLSKEDEEVIRTCLFDAATNSDDKDCNPCHLIRNDVKHKKTKEFLDLLEVIDVDAIETLAFAVSHGKIVYVDMNKNSKVPGLVFIVKGCNLTTKTSYGVEVLEELYTKFFLHKTSCGYEFYVDFHDEKELRSEKLKELAFL